MLYFGVTHYYTDKDRAIGMLVVGGLCESPGDAVRSLLVQSAFGCDCDPGTRCIVDSDHGFGRPRYPCSVPPRILRYLELVRRLAWLAWV